MSNSISLASSMETAIHVDGSGQKSEASLLSSKAAKFSYSSSDIQLSEETTVPSGGSTVALDGAEYHWTLNYQPSTHTLWVVGTSDQDIGLGIKAYKFDMDENDLYLQKDSSGDLVLTIV